MSLFEFAPWVLAAAFFSCWMSCEVQLRWWKAAAKRAVASAREALKQSEDLLKERHGLAIRFFSQMYVPNNEVRDNPYDDTIH